MHIDDYLVHRNNYKDDFICINNNRLYLSTEFAKLIHVNIDYVGTYPLKRNLHYLHIVNDEFIHIGLKLFDTYKLKNTFKLDNYRYLVYATNGEYTSFDDGHPMNRYTLNDDAKYEINREVIKLYLDSKFARMLKINKLLDNE